MESFEVTVDRKWSDSRSILGELSVNGRRLCYTLELPWLWNEREISCVPNGRYGGFVRYDKPDGWRIQLLGVPGGRAGIQIHVGNYPTQIKGCVLVGTGRAANKVINSHAAYDLFKQAFYGTTKPSSCPDRMVTVEFKGVQSTPWGDYPKVGGDRAV